METLCLDWLLIAADRWSNNSRSLITAGRRYSRQAGRQAVSDRWTTVFPHLLSAGQRWCRQPPRDVLGVTGCQRARARRLPVDRATHVDCRCFLVSLAWSLCLCGCTVNEGRFESFYGRPM